MALEALSSNEFLNFIIHETISSSAPRSSTRNDESLDASFLLDDVLKPCQGQIADVSVIGSSQLSRQMGLMGEETRAARRPNLAVQGRKKRRRKAGVCKNKEEAETQRMTHIAVERNRRKQMNEHLAVLRSLMPESYVQRGDQASIIGGAIEFVKELEHLLQSLEAKKIQVLHGLRGHNNHQDASTNSTHSTPPPPPPPPFSQFFMYPQYTWSQFPNSKMTSKTKAGMADIEVTLIETHANLRILSRKCPKQLLKLVAGFPTLYLTVLHINVTTMDPLVLYSISAKLEEGCKLTSVDDIAAAVHHMLGIIEEEEEEAAQLVGHHQLH